MIVNVTLEPAGKVGMVVLTLPVCGSGLSVGHTAAPTSLPQVQAKSVTPAGTASVKTAPSAAA